MGRVTSHGAAAPRVHRPSDGHCFRSLLPPTREAVACQKVGPGYSRLQICGWAASTTSIIGRLRRHNGCPLAHEPCRVAEERGSWDVHRDGHPRLRRCCGDCHHLVEKTTVELRGSAPPSETWGNNGMARPLLLLLGSEGRVSGRRCQGGPFGTPRASCPNRLPPRGEHSAARSMLRVGRACLGSHG